MSDRRRINAPAGATSSPVYHNHPKTPIERQRKPKELRRIFLQTGLVSGASGSAYLEIEAESRPRALVGQPSTVKLSCAVHGPKPLPRNATFSPNLQLSASVKLAPFATRIRRGYVRDATERDLGVHLENALKGMIIPDRWPKSGIDVAITVLEAEDVEADSGSLLGSLGLMNILSASITAASAALVDANIDVLDLMTGGVAAIRTIDGGQEEYLLDPAPTDHEDVTAASIVGYLPARDEVTEVWATGAVSHPSGDDLVTFEALVDNSVLAAKAIQGVLKEAILESGQRKQKNIEGSKRKLTSNDEDIEMKT